MGDPFSAAGLGLSVASFFFQALSGALKGINLLLDIKDAPQRYHTLILQLELEQQRLICWGDAVGLFREPNDDGKVETTIAVPLKGIDQDFLESLWSEIQPLVEKPRFTTRAATISSTDGLTNGYSGNLSSRWHINLLCDKFRSVELCSSLVWSQSVQYSEPQTTNNTA